MVLNSFSQLFEIIQAHIEADLYPCAISVNGEPALNIEAFSLSPDEMNLMIIAENGQGIFVFSVAGLSKSHYDSSAGFGREVHLVDTAGVPHKLFINCAMVRDWAD